MHRKTQRPESRISCAVKPSARAAALGNRGNSQYIGRPCTTDARLREFSHQGEGIMPSALIDGLKVNYVDSVTAAQKMRVAA